MDANPPNDANLRVPLPSSLKTELEQLARDTDRSVSWHVRQAIRAHLANQPTREGAHQ